MKKMKKLSLSMLCLALALLLLAGCGPTEAPKVPDGDTATGGYKERLIVAQSTDIVSTDPHEGGDTASLKAYHMVYDALLKRDSLTGEITPCLAERYEQVEDTKWVFSLREGVKFHNGDTLTADDVKFSLDRARQSARNAAILEMIEEVNVLDELTVEIVLSRPSTPFLARMCRVAASIISPKAVGTDGSFTPIGTGPYKLDQWVTGERIVYERNDDYFLGAPLTKTIVTRFIPEDSARVIALEIGEVDVAEALSAIDAGKVSGNPDLTLVQAAGSGVEYVGFNCSRAPFDNIKVRQALTHAVNKEELIEAVLNGDGIVAKTPVGPGVAYFYDGMEGFDYNPEQAKALLTEAGYPDGFTMSILVKGAQQQLSAQVLQSQFADIGVKLEIDFMENTAFFDALNRGDFESAMITRNNTTGDPADSLDFFYSPNIGAAGNRWRYINPRFDELFETGEVEADTTKRAAIYKEAQEILVDEAPWIYLFNPVNMSGTVKGLEGVRLDPARENDYSTIYLPQ